MPSRGSPLTPPNCALPCSTSKSNSYASEAGSVKAVKMFGRVVRALLFTVKVRKRSATTAPTSWRRHAPRGLVSAPCRLSLPAFVRRQAPAVPELGIRGAVRRQPGLHEGAVRTELRLVRVGTRHALSSRAEGRTRRRGAADADPRCGHLRGCACGRSAVGCRPGDGRIDLLPQPQGCRLRL